jgi:hypothetical protein
MRTSKLAALVGTSVLALGLGLIVAAPPALAGQLVYPVMNTSEQPPDGVWFRYDALNNNDTYRITGLGVYAGEHLRVKCFAVGAQVGPYALAEINYVILLDPGPNSDLAGCDKSVNAGGALANWLQLNPSAHLVVISGNLSPQSNSKGIQEVYFNEIRNIANANHSGIRSQALVCNYSIDHYAAFYDGQYWIQHKIGLTTSSCPWLTGQGKTFKPTAGWHP